LLSGPPDALYRHWQLPNTQTSAPVPVTVDELKAEQGGPYWAEVATLTDAGPELATRS
jgi:hypothetical protein